MQSTRRVRPASISARCIEPTPRHYPLLLLLLGTIQTATGASGTPPALEVYGSAPSIRAAALSANGTLLALLSTEGDEDFVLVRDLESGNQGRYVLTEIDAKTVRFIGDRYLAISASAENQRLNQRHNVDVGFAYLIDTKTGAIRPLLGSARGFLQPWDSVNQIIGVLENSGELLVPARTYSRVNKGIDTSLNGAIRLGGAVYRINPQSGKSAVFAGDRPKPRRMSGTRQKYSNAINWIVSPAGTILGRADYDQQSNRYSIHTKVTGEWQQLYDNSEVLANYIGGKPFSLMGTTLEEDDLLLGGLDQDYDEAVLYRLDFDGNLSGPLYKRENRDIKRVLTDDNRRAFGVEYDGLKPAYRFLDDRLSVAFARLQKRMPEFSLALVDWSADLGYLLLYVSASGESGTYYRFDVSNGKLTAVAKDYDVPPAWIGPLQTIEYRASDGLRIPAIVTWPPAGGTDNLPTILLPHGGPHTNDQLTFHWLAQFFSSRGYLVLQPNFRGSTGFGDAFKRAGHGQWDRICRLICTPA